MDANCIWPFLMLSLAPRAVIATAAVPTAGYVTELARFTRLVLFKYFLACCVLESFLRNRSSVDHEATAMMKAQFMSLWDGLDTSLTTQVMQPD